MVPLLGFNEWNVETVSIVFVIAAAARPSREYEKAVILQSLEGVVFVRNVQYQISRFEDYFDRLLAGHLRNNTQLPG